MIHVREAIDADLDQIASVWLQGWHATGLADKSSPTETELRTRLDSELAGGWTIDVACAGEAVIGMLATAPGLLSQLFLAPDWIGKGVGSALFRRATERLPDGFTLWTQPANTRARAFYESRGMWLDRIGKRTDKDEVAAFYRWDSPDV